jgi:hypothetical protein
MTDRVWRVRKNHTWIDAQLREGDGIVLRCYRDGQPIYVRRWPTRELALTDADARLKELLRVGWMTHW